MTGRMSPSYGIRSVQSMVPCVEVVLYGSGQDFYVVVKRCYGFTYLHALNRATKWARQNGDNR